MFKFIILKILCYLFLNKKYKRNEKREFLAAFSIHVLMKGNFFYVKARFVSKIIIIQTKLKKYLKYS